MKIFHTVWLLWFSMICASAQTTIYVATTGNDTNGTGTVGNPYFTISNGVAQATASDTVLVNPGVYTQTVNIYVTEDITVRGMNAPTGVVITTMYPDVNYSTRCVRITSPGAVFDGFTLERGYPPNSSAYQYAHGGGILMEAGLVTNCIIRNNRALHGGGAALWNSNSIMRNCWISNNVCDYGQSRGGGGVVFGEYHGWYGGASLLDCVINSNAAPFGGGIDSQSANGVISNCTIFANDVTNTGGGVGGGIYIRGPGMLIIDSVISNNVSGLGGGGIGFYQNGYPVIRNCTITANKARVVGGGVHSYRTSANGGAVISNCVISYNQLYEGNGYGSGIADGYNSQNTSTGTLTVIDSKITGNSGGTNDRYGAGAFVYTHGTAVFYNCEIVNNSLGYWWGSGAGMYIGTGSACVVV